MEPFLKWFVFNEFIRVRKFFSGNQEMKILLHPIESAQIDC